MYMYIYHTHRHRHRHRHRLTDTHTHTHTRCFCIAAEAEPVRRLISVSLLRPTLATRLRMGGETSHPKSRRLTPHHPRWRLACLSSHPPWTILEQRGRAEERQAHAIVRWPQEREGNLRGFITGWTRPFRAPSPFPTPPCCPPAPGGTPSRDKPCAGRPGSAGARGAATALVKRLDSS